MKERELRKILKAILLDEQNQKDLREVYRGVHRDCNSETSVLIDIAIDELCLNLIDDTTNNLVSINLVPYVTDSNSKMLCEFHTEDWEYRYDYTAIRNRVDCARFRHISNMLFIYLVWPPPKNYRRGTIYFR